MFGVRLFVLVAAAVQFVIPQGSVQKVPSAVEALLIFEHNIKKDRPF